MTARPKFRANRRILIIDDLPAIHDDIRKILNPPLKTDDAALRARAMEFAPDSPLSRLPEAPAAFDLSSALQGEEGVNKARAAAEMGLPFALAFVDGRMPPGWNGVETTRKLWDVCPDLQIVICTAYADYSWEEIRRILGANDNLVILKKPFDIVELRQLAESMTQRWQRNQEVRLQLDELNALLESGAHELEESNRKLLATLDQTEPGNAASTLNQMARMLEHAGHDADQFTSHLKNSKIASVAKLARILGENRMHLGAFGEKLPQFLAQLAIGLEQERHSALQEIARLTAKLERMRATVGLPSAPQRPVAPPAEASLSSAAK